MHVCEFSGFPGTVQAFVALLGSGTQVLVHLQQVALHVTSVLTVTSFFFLRRSNTHQEQAKTRAGGSILTPVSGDPPITFTQDSLPGDKAIAWEQAMPRQHPSCAGQIVEQDSLCRAGILSPSIIALVSRLFSSAFFFCNLNSQLTQLRCLGIK